MLQNEQALSCILIHCVCVSVCECFYAGCVETRFDHTLMLSERERERERERMLFLVAVKVHERPISVGQIM